MHQDLMTNSAPRSHSAEAGNHPSGWTAGAGRSCARFVLAARTWPFPQASPATFRQDMPCRPVDQRPFWSGMRAVQAATAGAPEFSP